MSFFSEIKIFRDSLTIENLFRGKISQAIAKHSMMVVML